jgi:2-methylcitrate dehydratase PrpD
MTALGELSEWASSLDRSAVPDSVLQLAKSQIISYIATVRAGLDHPLGQRVVGLYGMPFSRDAQSSASSLCALGTFMHYDDTAYSGHLSQSTVAVPLAYAYHLRAGGPALLDAVIAANETAARINAASTLGPHRGQAALHTHLVGAVAGRAAIEALLPSAWADAWSLALSAPPWCLRHGLFDGDAKVLGPASAVRAGLDAVDAALAGLRGPSDILENAEGFLAQYADVPLPRAATRGLGSLWHTETLSIKVHPGGPGVDAAVDAAGRLYAAHGPFDPCDLCEVRVLSSIYTVLADAMAQRYTRGPQSPLSALLLGVAYPVATTLLTGRFEPADLRQPAVGDPTRWAVASGIQVAHDPDMTRDFLAGTAPVGEALREAGPAAHEWLTKVGGPWLAELLGDPGQPSDSFARATKVTPARVEVATRDGKRWSAEVRIPSGAAGPETARYHRQHANDKLAAGGGGWMIGGLGSLENLEVNDLRSLMDEAFCQPFAVVTPGRNDRGS